MYIWSIVNVDMVWALCVPMTPPPHGQQLCALPLFRRTRDEGTKQIYFLPLFSPFFSHQCTHYLQDISFKFDRCKVRYISHGEINNPHSRVQFCAGHVNVAVSTTGNYYSGAAYLSQVLASLLWKSGVCRWYLGLYSLSGKRLTAKSHCCRDACQISKRLKKS